VGFLVVAGHQICANRPKKAKNRPKSAVFRKCLSIFLPTFGFQKRAFAHFFWAFFRIFVRTNPKIITKIAKAHFCQNESDHKMGKF